MVCWPRVELPGVGEHRDHDAEGRGGEHYRHEERSLDQACRPKRERHAESQYRREHEPGRRTPEPPAPQPFKVDLRPSQKEQERQADQGQNLQREVHLHEPDHSRPDQDAGQDLQDHRR